MKHGIENKWSELLILLVSTYVALGNLCNQCVEGLIMSKYTLTIHRVISGTMFMLTKMTKLPF
jgi:hypothetical protein